jgi:osmotically-inducible protein OsmY
MRKSIRIAAVALFAAAAWTGSAQTRSTAKPAPAAHPRADSAARPRLSDAQIEADIRARLAKSPKLGPEKFQVHVQGGVATFEGKTNVIQHKGTATRMAKSAGAIAVNNHIQISEAAREKAADNLEKGRRRAQITRGEARSDGRTDARTATVRR